jgi:hypothetical protein
MANKEDKAPVLPSNATVPFGEPLADKPGIAYTSHSRKEGDPIILKVTTFGHPDDPKAPQGGRPW